MKNKINYSRIATIDVGSNAIRMLISNVYDINGKKHGSWMIWDNEGHLKALMVYENGKRVGSWKTWGSDGQIAQTINY